MAVPIRHPAPLAADGSHALAGGLGYRLFHLLEGGSTGSVGNSGANRFGRARVAQSEGPQDRERVRSDQALMSEIAGGSQSAFARLLGELAPRMLRFARSLLPGSPGEADEIVQEAFLRLWQQAPAWRPEGRVSTWLHQVVYRLCLDQLRRRRPSVEIDTLEAELEDDAPSAETRLIRIEEADAVRDALARLPQRQREALILCHFQDLSQAEAAAVMAIGESAYESLLARARRKLRAELIADGGNGEGGKT
jgi:RNA polymerase sigma-70 factor (ECF subfamily)